MAINNDQRAELEAECEAVGSCIVGNTEFHLLTGLRIAGCTPPKVDAMLCMGERDGYPTRLFFAERVAPAKPYALNWKAQTERILERNWHVFSWKVPQGLSPIETLHEHLKPLR